MARVIFRKTIQYSLVDYYAKPWLIFLNDKKNVIELIEKVNKPCIGKNLCKAIKDKLSFKSLRNHN